MNLRVIILCFVTVWANAAAYGSHIDESTAYNSEENYDEKDKGTSSGEIKSSELLFSGEYESKEEPTRAQYNPERGTRSHYEKDFESSGYTKYGRKNDRINSDDDKEGAEEDYEAESSQPAAKPAGIKGAQVKEKSNGFSQFTKPSDRLGFTGKTPYWTEKFISSRTIPTTNHYPLVSKKLNDAEMIFPQDQVLFLPLVNGKPKPYDGYRAPPKTDIYQTIQSGKMKENPEEREKRLSQGEIIYGKPRVALRPKHLLKKRSAAEYRGGIQPHYDFTDSKLTWNTANSLLYVPGAGLNKRKADYPDDFFETSHDEFFRSFKSRLDSDRNGNKDDHTYYSEESYEASSEESGGSDESREETKQAPAYAFDGKFKVARTAIQLSGMDELPSESQTHEKVIKRKSKTRDSEALIGVPEIPGKTLIEVAENPEEATHPGSIHFKLKVRRESKDDAIQNSHVQDESSNIEKPLQLVNHRGKRSAKDAVSFRPYTKSGRVDRGKTLQSYKKPNENLRIDYKRPNLFNFTPANKKYTNGGYSGYSGYNSYNIYDRPKSTVNWNGHAKNGHSFNYKSDSSKHHEGSFTYKNPEKTYGVPASIYGGILESSEEYDEPYEKVTKGEHSKNLKYSHRSYSSTRYANHYKTKQSEHGENRSSPLNRAFKPANLSNRNSYNHKEFQFRPKKDAQDDKFKEDEEATTDRKKYTKGDEGDDRKPQEFPASESRLAPKEESKSEPKEPNGQNDFCKKEKRGEMLCMVCSNEKTSATYEQCRFSSKSSEKFYAFEHQKSADSNKNNNDKSPNSYRKSSNGESQSDQPNFPPNLRAIFKGYQSPQSSFLIKTPAALLSGTSGRVGFRKPAGAFINQDLKRFLRKTERRQTVEDGNHFDEYMGPQYQVDESNEEGMEMGNDGLTFASFGGDDFGNAFLEFGKHATEDMFHPNFSGEEGFGSDDNFDFDSLSFDEIKEDDHSGSEEEFSF